MATFVSNLKKRNVTLNAVLSPAPASSNRGMSATA
jgi:hypothetical protein